MRSSLQDWPGLSSELIEATRSRLGIRLVIQTALQSPHFLYRIEFGTPDKAANVVPFARAGVDA